MSLESLRSEAAQALMLDQPGLHVSVADGRVVIAGDYFLNEEITRPSPDGPLATFSVKVLLHPAYPDVEPMVFETGGIIPKGRHLNPNGTCCLGVWERWLVQAKDLSVAAYFDGPFRDYFLSQLHFQVHGEWPFGELSHGLEGIVEAYASVLGIPPDHQRVAGFLKVLAKPGLPRGHWPCPCNSGRNIRNCHRTELAEFRDGIPPAMASRMLNRMADPF